MLLIKQDYRRTYAMSNRQRAFLTSKNLFCQKFLLFAGAALEKKNPPPERGAVVSRSISEWRESVTRLTEFFGDTLTYLCFPSLLRLGDKVKACKVFVVRISDESSAHWRFSL